MHQTNIGNCIKALIFAIKKIHNRLTEHYVDFSATDSKRKKGEVTAGKTRPESLSNHPVAIQPAFSLNCTDNFYNR